MLLNLGVLVSANQLIVYVFSIEQIDGWDTLGRPSQAAVLQSVGLFW